MKKLDGVMMVLVILGALNWGLVGLFAFDLFDFFLEQPWLDRVMYTIVGFAGFFKVIYWMRGNWKTRFEEN